jgi:pyridoxal phosphate enzyme (YggS family)
MKMAGGNPASPQACLQLIEGHLARINSEIDRAAQKSGRHAEDIVLMAVTKGRPANLVRLAYRAGLRTFGENRGAEGRLKQQDLPDLDQAIWHMIGHIQSRKACDIPGSFAVVHSVDRLKVARLLDQRSAELDIRLPVYLECNVSGEASKFGWPGWRPDEWMALAGTMEPLSALLHLQSVGLMTMAPIGSANAELHRIFGRLRELRDFLTKQLHMRLEGLSMGMSDDYPIAIEEGATIIRLGRAIFEPTP